MCIALDNYLGINNEIVKNLPPTIPQYFKNKMDKKYIVADVMHLFLMNRFSQNLGDDFISTIILKHLRGFPSTESKKDKKEATSAETSIRAGMFLFAT